MGAKDCLFVETFCNFCVHPLENRKLIKWCRRISILSCISLHFPITHLCRIAAAASFAFVLWDSHPAGDLLIMRLLPLNFIQAASLLKWESIKGSSSTKKVYLTLKGDLVRTWIKLITCFLFQVLFKMCFGKEWYQ